MQAFDTHKTEHTNVLKLIEVLYTAGRTIVYGLGGLLGFRAISLLPRQPDLKWDFGGQLDQPCLKELLEQLLFSVPVITRVFPVH